jgi:hypothetical protein
MLAQFMVGHINVCGVALLIKVKVEKDGGSYERKIKIIM